MLFDKYGFGEPNESIYNEMVKEILSPAQMKHKQLRGLKGYKDYCLKTRYRLIPLIW